MTSWTPDLSAAGSPLASAIADALARDIEAGHVAPGTCLPTHRALATQLSVNVGTVTRAYAEAKRRGLVHGVVGSGTYVSDRSVAPRGLQAERIDLALNLPAIPGPTPERTRVLAELATENVDELFEGYTPAGRPSHREAGTRWLARAGHAATPERVLVTAGAQHALSGVFAAMLDVGRTVLCEELTYAGTKNLARALDLRLVGVAMDRYGIDPAALEDACGRTRANALYVMPTMQNPTGIVWPEERRREVAEIARRHDLTIVEDDTYAFLKTQALPPLSALAPERTIVITSLSKCLGVGLRTGYLLAPEDSDHRERTVEQLETSLAALTWMAAPLPAEIGSRWIVDGTAARHADEIAVEARARRQLADSILGAHDSPSDPSSCHLWLPLPEPWRGGELVTRALSRGVALSEAEQFAAGRRRTPAAVRLCLGTPRQREQLVEGLEVVAELLREGPSPHAIA